MINIPYLKSSFLHRHEKSIFFSQWNIIFYDYFSHKSPLCFIFRWLAAHRTILQLSEVNVGWEKRKTVVYPAEEPRGHHTNLVSLEVPGCSSIYYIKKRQQHCMLMRWHLVLPGLCEWRGKGRRKEDNTESLPSQLSQHLWFQLALTKAVVHPKRSAGVCFCIITCLAFKFCI